MSNPDIESTAVGPIMTPPKLNNMSDGTKSVVSFAAVAFFSLLLGMLVYLIAGRFFGYRDLLTFYISTTALLAWGLIGGLQRNGEYEQSIGGLFGQVTGWVIPPGISWWFPAPIGQSLRKSSTEKRTLDRSIIGKTPLVDVKTRDGGQVMVGAVKTWGIVDVRKAGQFTDADLVKQVDSLLERSSRFFSLYFDSDEDISPDPDTALSHRRLDFSRYLMGAQGIIVPARAEVTDPGGKVVAPAVAQEIIPNNTAQKAEELGILIYNVDVTDVNEPKEVQEARNKAAAEYAEAQGEKLDIGSIRARVLELMWGTSDSTEIADMKKKRVRPLISEQEALRAVRAARKDLEDINISGDAGDFTKGTVAAAKMKKDTKPK